MMDRILSFELFLQKVSSVDHDYEVMMFPDADDFIRTVAGYLIHALVPEMPFLGSDLEIQIQVEVKLKLYSGNSCSIK